MHLSNCKINVNGFQLSDKKQSSIQHIVQALQNRSPSNSVLNLSIVSGESGAIGFFTIVSRSIKFESYQIGVDPMGVVKLLNKDLLAQLTLWVKQRKF